MNTPWGQSDSETKLRVGPGVNDEIISVGTPSHGGYFVPDHLLSRIPANQQAWAAKWSQSPNWYEEDCCWAAVALAFPSLFNDNARVLAADLVKTYCGSSVHFLPHCRPS
jgi:hypothetical protein